MEGLPKEPSQKERLEAATQKIKEFGRLALTAEDHRAIGSTPTKRLAENPEKRDVDLMSDAEVGEYLESIKELAHEHEDFKEEYETSIRFLRSLGRLPVGFD